MAFFFRKPVPCWSGFFICSVYCHYTINKSDERLLQTCAIVWAKPQLLLNCSDWPHLEGWLPSSPLSHTSVLLSSCQKQFIPVFCTPDPAEKDTETLALYNPHPQSCSPHIPLALPKLKPNGGLGSKCFFEFPLQIHNWVSVFSNLYIHPPASSTGKWQAGEAWRREGELEKGRETTVSKQQICYYWVRRTASQKLWLTALSDIGLLLVNKCNWPNIYLPTGKEFHFSQDYRYQELNMQISALILILHACMAILYL